MLVVVWVVVVVVVVVAVVGRVVLVVGVLVVMVRMGAGGWQSMVGTTVKTNRSSSSPRQCL